MVPNIALIMAFRHGEKRRAASKAYYATLGKEKRRAKAAAKALETMASRSSEANPIRPEETSPSAKRVDAREGAIERDEHNASASSSAARSAPRTNRGRSVKSVAGRMVDICYNEVAEWESKWGGKHFWQGIRARTEFEKRKERERIRNELDEHMVAGEELLEVLMQLFLDADVPEDPHEVKWIFKSAIKQASILADGMRCLRA